METRPETGERPDSGQRPIFGLQTEQGPRRTAPAKMDILISVFLIMIGFFVVLNANSGEDIARAGAVLASVHQAFDGGSPKAIKPFGPDDEAGPFARDLSEMSRAFEEMSGVRPVYLELPDGALYTVIALEGLFDPASATLATTSATLVTALASASRSAAMAEIMLLVGGGGSLAENRAGALRGALQAREANFSRVSIGLLPDRKPGLFLFISRSENVPGESVS